MAQYNHHSDVTCRLQALEGQCDLLVGLLISSLTSDIAIMSCKIVVQCKCISCCSIFPITESVSVDNSNDHKHENCIPPGVYCQLTAYSALVISM